MEEVTKNGRGITIIIPLNRGYIKKLTGFSLEAQAGLRSSHSKNNS